jgi:hypothetical protein
LIAVGAVAAMAVVPVIYSTPRFIYDSGSYLRKVSLTGERLPVVPVLYALLGRNPRAIVVFQATFGALCWSYLALITLRIARRPYCYVAFGGVLLISCSDYVTMWYPAILSDSVSLSLLVLLLASIASWLVERRFFARVLIVAVLWAFTRDTNGYLLLVFGLAALGVVLIRRQSLAAALAAVLAIMAGVGVIASTNAGGLWEEPFYHVMAERVLVDPARTGWFVGHGMPSSPTLRQLGGPYYLRVDTAFRQSPGLASFRSWMHRSGERTYLEYALAHSWWVVSGTFGHHEELKPGPGPVSYYAGAPHHWLPMKAREFLLVHRQTTLVALAVIAAVVLLVRRRSLHREARALLWWVALTAMGVLGLIGVWVGDSWEIGRHSVGPTVQVAIGLLSVIALALGSRPPAPA